MITKIAVIIALIGSLFGGWFFLEDHFALAKDHNALESYTHNMEQQTIQTVKDLRIQIIADNLNDLDTKEKFAPDGLTTWDKVRQNSLQRQWEVLLK